MISPQVTSLAVLCCIAFAASSPTLPPVSTTISTPISTPINIETTTLTVASCHPPIADNDVLLYQSYESMHKWVNNKLDAKSANFKEEAAQTLAKLQETMHAQTEQQLNTLQQAVNGEKAEILQKFTQLQETITSNLDAMKNEMDQLRAQISETRNAGAQMDAFKEQIKSGLVEQNQQIQHQATAIQDINTRVAQCVTDIKVSGPESVPIWNGPGYGDEGNLGYLMTGVLNYNNDKYADTAHRRLVSFLKNGEWTPIHD